MRRYLLALSIVAASAAALAEDDGWTLGVDDSGYDAREMMYQASAVAIADEYATKEVNPVLSFGCVAGGDGTITATIDWQRFISSFSTEAGFSVDEGKAAWLKLAVDSSNKQTLANAADTAALLSQLEGGKRLTVEIAPYSEPSVFVHFDIENFAAALARLKEAC